MKQTNIKDCRIISSPLHHCSSTCARIFVTSIAKQQKSDLLLQWFMLSPIVTAKRKLLPLKTIYEAFFILRTQAAC